MTELAIPVITADDDNCSAALKYAKEGFHVGPAKAGSKNPGSVLGKGWQHKTSRDPQVIASWFPGTNHDVFIHLGRSGAMAFDVDYPAMLAPPIQQAIQQHWPPYQSTRPDEPGRGHYIFAVPAGRRFGNGLGALANGWGELRGENGVVMVKPSHHPSGEYDWGKVGPVPILPGYLANQLPDAMEASEAATDADVAAFVAKFSEPTEPRPELLNIHLQGYLNKVAAGESRHSELTGPLANAMKEAAAGHLDAKQVADTLESVFLEAVAKPPISSKQGASRTGPIAVDEYRGMLAWAVGQARAADPEETRARITEKFPPQFAEVTVAEIETSLQASTTGKRRINLTWADTITPKPVRWAWIYLDQGRIPLGSLVVAAGREGCGKSQFAIWLAAHITKGTLTGVLEGRPRRVIVVATEDSWQHTIVPRLIAADADRSLVARADVVTEGDDKMVISLPSDISLLEATINEYEVALVILDPMLSVITDKLDSYRARDMRTALEPLVAVADRTGCLMLGIAHFNKGSGTDAATLLSGSHAFRDVPRALFGFVATKTERVFSQIKNSLGRSDLPSFTYTIEPFTVPTPEGDADVSKFVLGGVSHRDVADILADGDDGDDADIRNAAQEFLLSYLVSNNLAAPASKVIAAGIANGFTHDQMKHARARMRDPKVISSKPEFGTGWEWRIETAND